jgi:type IV pilus secretin PilQ/predicted competence protein
VTVNRRLGVVISVLCLAGALLSASGSETTGAATLTARLTSIRSQVRDGIPSVLIQTSEPTSYVTTRLDPLTVCLDFRNVTPGAFTNAIVPDAGNPVTAVVVESTESLGAPASRIRISLDQPLAYRVRSDRETVIVQFDPGAKPATEVRPVLRPESALDPVQAIDPIAALGLAPPPAEPARVSMVAQQQAAPASPAPAERSGAPEATREPQPGERRFTGHPVSLDFQGADLRAVLRTFSEISGLNIVIDPAVTGSVDVALRDVPWDQALDLILRANKLGYVVEGTIVRIAPLSVLADEEAQRRKLADEQALAGQLRVLTKSLSYAKAEQLRDLLTKSALSQRGTVQVDPRTNTLIITDLADRLATASDLIASLDRPEPQVEIEARIVQTTKSYARKLGVQWGFNGRVDPALGNTTALAFPNSGSLGGTTGASVTGAPQQGTGSTAPNAVNLGVPGATTAVGLALGSINGSFNLDVALSALETSGNGRILSTPRVSTQNNVEAEITQGTQIPIQTVANNTVTVTFKDAALTLKVTPQITAAGTVIMKIALENGQADFTKAINGIPPINTQRASTQVLVSDGQTTVIGGIVLSTQQVQNDRTPGLGSIPLLRWLFKRDATTEDSSELLIFITPRISKV